MHFTYDFKIAPVKSGFVIDLDSKKAWEMNTENAPSWISQGVWADDRMFVWGGYEIYYEDLGPKLRPHSRGASYQLSTNSWTSIDSGPLEPRIGHNLIWHNGELIIFGGQSTIASILNSSLYAVKGAAKYSPGVFNRIYFTQKSKTAMRQNKIHTNSTDAEFYIEGEIDNNTDVKIFRGIGCHLSNEGELPSYQISSLGFGKKFAQIPLRPGENVVSALIRNENKEICTNSLNFIKD